jgi:hypothetical protein
LLSVQEVSFFGEIREGKEKTLISRERACYTNFRYISVPEKFIIGLNHFEIAVNELKSVYTDTDLERNANNVLAFAQDLGYISKGPNYFNVSTTTSSRY